MWFIELLEEVGDASGGKVEWFFDKVIDWMLNPSIVCDLITTDFKVMLMCIGFTDLLSK